jgi:hypothetical protein
MGDWLGIDLHGWEVVELGSVLGMKKQPEDSTAGRYFETGATFARKFSFSCEGKLQAFRSSCLGYGGRRGAQCEASHHLQYDLGFPSETCDILSWTALSRDEATLPSGSETLCWHVTRSDLFVNPHLQFGWSGKV